MLHKNCCIPLIGLKPFPIKPETSNSDNKFKKSYGILQVAKWPLIFLQIFFSDFYFLPLLEHFKLGASLQLKNIKMVPPLI